jgi:hypothetical protein
MCGKCGAFYNFTKAPSRKKKLKNTRGSNDFLACELFCLKLYQIEWDGRRPEIFSHKISLNEEAMKTMRLLFAKNAAFL